MYDKLVLVDVNNVIVKDSRDVSEYIFEAIRSRYGLEAQFDINNYEGLSSKAMLRSILRKNGVPEEDINSRIDGCAEELGYTYYNVTGRDAIKTMDGSRQFLAELKKEGALVGIATGEIIEREKRVDVSITDEDIKLVQEQSGISDREKVVKALQEANGDIAKAILSLKGSNQT